MPNYIGSICPHCGANLVCKQTVDPNADAIDYICSNEICYVDNHCVFYIDMSQQELIEIENDPDSVPWPTKDKTFEELQAIICECRN